MSHLSRRLQCCVLPRDPTKNGDVLTQRFAGIERESGYVALRVDHRVIGAVFRPVGLQVDLLIFER